MSVNKITVVSGNFNILHPGHLRLFKYAKDLGNKLVVCVYSDKLSDFKTHIPESLRLEALQHSSFVDEAILIDQDINEVILKLRPEYVVKGKEHKENYNKELEVLNIYGGKLFFSSGESIFSSFDLIKKELDYNQNSFLKLPHDFFKRHNLTLASIGRTINSFKKLEIIVIGDLIIDEYITCDALGMSQEDPTIVVTPIDQKKYMGGAGIVAAHAASLGAKVHFISTTGNDENRDFAKKYFSKCGVVSYLHSDVSRPTTLKKRYRCKGKTLLRVSHLHQSPINNEIQNEIIKQIDTISNSCDLIIFSDFNYGCIPTELLNKIIELGAEKNIPMVADSQCSSQIGDITRFKNMLLLTPTEREARLGVMDQESGLVVLAEKISKISSAKNILLKIGGQGVLIHAEHRCDHSSDWLTDQIPALNDLPVDVAGAGDSMLITCAMALAIGSNIWEAAAIGSIAAAVQVGRVGNIPLTIDELLNQLKN